MKNFKEFTNKYPLTKTLRFELIPQGKTLEHINKKGLVEQDKKRAKSYKEMKKTIDGYHKYFIELALSQVTLENLESYSQLYNQSKERKQEESFKKEYERVQTGLRKEVVNKGFRAGEAKKLYAKLFKKELITQLIKNWRKEKQEEVYFDEDFEKFTTYFNGFNENRKNMYTDKDQSTAIAYRLIHENLPKFIDNIKIFEKIKAIPKLHNKCETLYQEIEEYLNIVKIDDAFELNYYNEVLIQKDIDVYNLIIGGRTPVEGQNKIQGLNEYINLYNQQQKDKKDKIPKLKILYKQILSDRVDTSFLQEKFEDDEHSTASQKVLDAIEYYYKSNLLNFKPVDKNTTENILQELKTLLAEIPTYDLEKIYIRNDQSLSNISKSLFKDWKTIKAALAHQHLSTIEIGKKGLTKKQDKEKESYLKQGYFSIAEIEQALYNYRNENETLKELQENTKPVANYFQAHFIAQKESDTDKEFNLIANIEAKYSCIKGLLSQTYPQDKKLNQDKETIYKIKLFLDSMKEYLHFCKPLALPKDTTLEKDENFYGLFNIWFEQFQLLTPFYNKVRNFANQKPYSVEKLLLFFENKGQFLGGWVDSHTDKSDNATQAGGYLFRKKNSINEYDYYLGISGDAKLFRSHLKRNISVSEKSEYERLDYYQLKSASVYGNSYVGESYEDDKNQLISAIDEFIRSTNHKDLKEDIKKYKEKQTGDKKITPSGLLSILEEEKYIQEYQNLFLDDEFSKVNAMMIKNLKDTILSLERVPEAQNYNDIDFSTFKEPISIIEELSSKKSFSYFAVDNEEFETACAREEKPLLLFKITNKDLSFSDTFSSGLRKSRGKENLHTLYFKGLMSGNQNVYDIGTGMVFYRKKSLNYKPDIYKKGHHYDELKNKFNYPIISNKRFTEDKFQFHLSISMNYQSKNTKSVEYNSQVLEHLKNNPEVNIIGIDRGERHLIYVSLINQKGEILEQFSLNEIINSYHDQTGKLIEVKTDYHNLLDAKEKQRDKARKDWGIIETIKELKEGYISQVVHKIATMMVEHNAIVVLEDLNFGFKRGRFKVEKQVYQKLEKRLIDKLNYLVINKDIKDNQADKLGGIYHALQLTNKFKSFKEIGKQSGFLFYVPAWNTSKIDPTTGFVNLFDTRYHKKSKAQEFFSTFDEICFNTQENHFEFAFDYSNFTTRADGTQTKWNVCTHGKRIKTFRNKDKNNQWDNLEINLTDEFVQFFNSHEIDYNSNKLQQQIISQDSKSFFEQLLKLFKLTLQMRNSITNSNVDYLVSPVKNKQGYFYDSQEAGDKLPKDADANGAYHIAKKGLVLLNQLNSIGVKEFEKLKKPKAGKTQWLPNKLWLQYVQSNL